ncbi:MAG TPA: hypothetical protein VF188_04295 [Longimicrobiales bacterium]
MVRGNGLSADREARGLRMLAVIVLTCWCAVSVEWFARSMRGPAGFVVRRPPGTEGVVGMPLIGASEVTITRRLLPPGPDGDRWLLVLPAGSDPFVLAYIRYQLAHVEYPRRIEVRAGPLPPSLDGYAGIIAAPDLVLDRSWRPTSAEGGFVRYERGEP